MSKVKCTVINNIIYTPEVECLIDPKGMGYYYYNKMKENKNKIAQIDGFTKEEDTFGSLLERCIRTALTMMDKGIKPGDHISLCTFHHLNSAVPHIASYLSGTIMAAVDPTMSVNEVTCLLKQTMPKLIFVCSTAVDLIEKVVKRLGTNTVIVVFGDTMQHISFSEFISPHKNESTFKPYQPKSLNDVALIAFSSGSTGMPKGICYSHLNMLSFSESFATDRQLLTYTIANPYWTVFSSSLHASIAFGSIRLIFPSFDLQNPWQLYFQEVDVGFLNTNQALHMVRSEKPKLVDSKNVKVFYVGANPISIDQLIEIKSTLLHTTIFFCYSQSEIFRQVFEPIPIASEVMTKYIGSVGTIRPGICYKVVDVNTEKVLGPNEIGELRLKSKSQFIGYLNQDSSRCFDSDGWLKTGDLAYYNEELYFYVTDRLSENFKYLNHHISPVEIEQIILNLEPVETAVVIGKPHESDNNHPMAIIKLKPNAKKISADEIIKHVENNLEDKKRLRGGVFFVDNIPMTVNGKVNRFKLKKVVLNNEI